MHQHVDEREPIEALRPDRTVPFLRTAALTLAAVGFVLGYGLTAQTLWRVWMHNPNYSHGFLIAPVTAWLIWRQREVFRRLVPDGSWGGLSLLLPAIALQVVGLRGDVTLLQGLSLILALGGIAWQVFGTEAARRLTFPLGFLIFMIPALPWFMDVVSFDLKLLAARGAVQVAHAFGVAVQREGVNLVFADGILAVENACSGLRSLIALLALGALFAYLSSGPMIRRLLLFALAIPIAVAANLIRVSALCIYAGLASVDAAAGLFHEVGGYALFVVAFLMLAVGKRILRC